MVTLWYWKWSYWFFFFLVLILEIKCVKIRVSRKMLVDVLKPLAIPIWTNEFWAYQLNLEKRYKVNWMKWIRRVYRKKNEPPQNSLVSRFYPMFPRSFTTFPRFSLKKFSRFASANVAVVWIRAWSLLRASWWWWVKFYIFDPLSQW